MANDSLAAAVDWFDAYRGKSLDIVEMYLPTAKILCGCDGISRAGFSAIETYWIDRFRYHPALELVDLKPTDGSAVFISYHTPDAIVKAVLAFDDQFGKIAWHRCSPDGAISRVRAGVR
jgi:hypothetical protein